MRMLLVPLLAGGLWAQSSGWPVYGGDAAGTRYSPLQRIDRRNVTGLRLAWTYHTGELDQPSPLNRKAAFEATPILIEGTLYLSTPFNRVIALDPETGKARWVHDPKVDRSRSYSEVTSRGVAAWSDRRRPASEPCRLRIFEGTIDARLLAIDGRSGKPCADFGQGGQVDLTQGIGLRDRGDYQVTSPPVVVGDLVITGSAIGDNRAAVLERGTVRAFDARNGKLRWSWDPIPASLRSGAANAWSILSADPARDLVFVPTGSASPDYFGGERPGDDRHANSVVALRASTGQLVWAFQVAHHDLWDYDVASQPTLVTVRIKGRPVDAVAVTTKIGHLFLLDRVTGKPLLPVEERPVPQSRVPGEHTWPTQPFPLNPPLVPQKLTPESVWGANEQDRKWCAERVRGLRAEGLFTPPDLGGSLQIPGNAGGVAWGGAAFARDRGLLLVNTNNLPFWVKLIPRKEFEAARSAAEQNRFQGEFARQEGTPYALYREMLRAPSGYPCVAPPWGALTAVDLATGAIRWQVPLGTLMGQPGSPAMGGPIVTAGGLVFDAAAMDNRLRAFDIENGKEIWSVELPAGGQATPMTYSVGGRQFVVLSAGGHGKLGTRQGDSVVAYALP